MNHGPRGAPALASLPEATTPACTCLSHRPGLQPPLYRAHQPGSTAGPPPWAHSLTATPSRPCPRGLTGASSMQGLQPGGHQPAERRSVVAAPLSPADPGPPPPTLHLGTPAHCPPFQAARTPSASALPPQPGLVGLCTCRPCSALWEGGPPPRVLRSLVREGLKPPPRNCRQEPTSEPAQGSRTHTSTAGQAELAGLRAAPGRWL